MNTILIAEDEKFIRKGLKTMIQRTGIPVGEILEARDGEEALTVLRDKPVDLLITDIRMPRMDGIELVSHLEELERRPMVLAVSGFDDFSYAVKMMQNGAQDYLLKPVEREQLLAALEKLEARFCQQQTSQVQQVLDMLRQLMLEELPDGERQTRLEQVRQDFFTGPYVGLCTREEKDSLLEHVLCLRGTGRSVLYVVPEEDAEHFAALLSLPLGRSQSYRGAEYLHICYQEAHAAWEQSFFTGTVCTGPTQQGSKTSVAAKQLAGLVGLSRGEEVSRLLSQEAERVSRGETSPYAFARLCEEFILQLSASYKTVLNLDEAAERFANIWGFPGCANYLEELGRWLESLSGQAAQTLSDYGNRQKILRAVQYMEENFRTPLNMAQVSNEVSMNYSLFSQLFKQYTGSNFVNYLQELRLNEAKRLLAATDWRVNEICHRAGFSDEKHFLKVFKVAVGLSPTEYRKSVLLLEQNGETT